MAATAEPQARAGEAAPAPAPADAAGDTARQAAEDVKRDVLARPQAAAVHGNLVPATVLNLLA